MYHLTISVPRRLACKRSNSQQTCISRNILPSNISKSRVHSKSKEVRFDTSSEIHLYRDGISDITQHSQGTSRSYRIPTSDCQIISNSDSSFGTNFSFSFGQTAADFFLLGRLHLRPLLMCLLSVWRPSFRSSSSDQQFDSISFEMVDGYQSLRSGNVIHPPDPILFRNASHYGWGAYLEPMRTVLSWSLDDQSQLQINILEIKAIHFALKKAKQYIHHSCVMISTDNTTVVSYISKQGGTHSPDLCVEVWGILRWCLEHDIVLRIRHMTGP